MMAMKKLKKRTILPGFYVEGEEEDNPTMMAVYKDPTMMAV
jgi:hypothetical protein